MTSSKLVLHPSKRRMMTKIPRASLKARPIYPLVKLSTIFLSRWTESKKLEISSAENTRLLANRWLRRLVTRIVIP